MKKRRWIILGAVVLLMAVAVAATITQVPKWSQKSFEAVVEGVVTQPDEIRLIVQRTTEIYDNPRNALCISEDTALIGADGKAVSIADFHPGDAVRVTLKDAFLEEIPFYYPTVYEIKVMDAKQ